MSTTSSKDQSSFTRGKPVQRRSQERIAQILTATAELLLEMPPEDITTTEVAKKAAIPVSSLYRYFPNVFSIFNALAEPVIEEKDKRIFEIINDATPQDGGWRMRHRHVMKAIRKSFEEYPYYRAMLPLLMTRPELREPKEKIVETIATRLAERWKNGGDGFSGADPHVVARMATQISLAVETHLVTHSSTDEINEYFKELTVNLDSYLSNYLKD